MINQAEGVQEQLRLIVRPGGWDYAVFWQPNDETRTLVWAGCCCSGSVGATGNGNLVASTSSRYLESSIGCPDITSYHPATLICSLLASMPSSVSLDSGIQGRVFQLGGQSKWVHEDPSEEGQEMAVLTKVYIPVQSGLVELGVTNHVAENEALVNFVRDRCGEPWPALGKSKQESSGNNSLDASGSQGTMMDQQAVKVYYPRHFPTSLDSSWPSSHPWEQEDPTLEPQLLGNVDYQKLMNQLPSSITNFPHHGTLAESPRGSALSKDDGEVKRGESSDGSDPMDDEDEKGGLRSGRRHLSKNLVAERKRRKKLNERLYSLRALVPKITKMDRASILGDAIEYVKELQQQVKELQEELFMNSKGNSMPAGLLDFDIRGGTADHREATLGAATTDIVQCPVNIDSQNVTVEVIERQGDQELTQPMQVEVNKLDCCLFSLRIFCEKRPGVFVKLMQALDVLDLNVIHANVTIFRGLILFIFNAEIRDKEQLLGADKVRETLLEMASQSSHRTFTNTSDCSNLQSSPIGGERVLENVTEGPLP